MKAGFCLLLLAGFLRAEEEPEGTVWYDSKGEIAVIDPPAAGRQAKEPFVPQWGAREERRDRALRGGNHRRRSRAGDFYPVWGWGFPLRSCHSSPWLPPACARPFPDIRVIIR